METKIYKMNGTENGSLTLNEEVFGKKAHPQTINDVVKSQLNNQRHGTVCVKTRAEVVAGKRKIYRQKGTGRARQGNVASPLHQGGGKAFGPRQRTFDQRPPKKLVDRAIIGVLTDKAENGGLRVVEGLDFSTGKTKDVVAFMSSQKLEKALCVLPEISVNTKRAVNNLHNIKVVTPMHVNVVDMLKYGQVVISDKAVKMLEEVLVK